MARVQLLISLVPAGIDGRQQLVDKAKYYRYLGSMAGKKIKNKKGILPATSSSGATPVGLSLVNNFYIQLFLLAMTCCVFYGNTFRNGYAVDDDWVIVKNEAVCRGIAGIPAIFTSDIYDSYYHQYNAANQLNGGRYRPLSLVSYAIEQQLFGQTGIDVTDKDAVKENAGNTRLLYARHVINVLLYLLSVIVLLRLLRKIVFPSQPLAAFLSVLLFAIHPVHTEVVANIKSRDEILSLLFITLTLIYAWNFKENNKLPGLLLSLSCFLLALLSKEYAVSLVVLLPLMFYIFKGYSAAESIKTVLPYLGVLVLYFLMRFSFVPFKGGHEEGEVLNDPYLLATGMQSVATKIATLLNYPKLLVWPYPLSVDYSYNQLPYKNWNDLMVWLSLLFHLCLVAAMLFYIRKRHVLAFAIAVYLLNLFLVSNLVFNIGAPMGERLIYHSSLGFCICLAWLLNRFYARRSPSPFTGRALAAISLLLVFTSGIITIVRNEDWESNSTLYRKDVLTAGNSAITNANAGLSYLNDAPLQDNEPAKRDMLNKAMNYFNKAISIHPGYTFAFINRGIVFFEQGDLEHAKQDWDTAARQFPSHPDLPGLYASYYINSSISKFGSKGNYEQAIVELKKGAALAPHDLIILFNLGYFYNLAGKKDSAISAFQQIIDLSPYDSLAIKCASYINVLKKAS